MDLINQMLFVDLAQVLANEGFRLSKTSFRRSDRGGMVHYVSWDHDPALSSYYLAATIAYVPLVRLFRNLDD